MTGRFSKPPHSLISGQLSSLLMQAEMNGLSECLTFAGSVPYLAHQLAEGRRLIRPQLQDLVRLLGRAVTRACAHARREADACGERRHGAELQRKRDLHGKEYSFVFGLDRTKPLVSGRFANQPS